MVFDYIKIIKVDVEFVIKFDIFIKESVAFFENKQFLSAKICTFVVSNK